MKDRSVRLLLQIMVVGMMLMCAALPLLAAMKNWAVIVAAGSKLQDVSLADLAKYYRGTQKTWPDGRGFTLVVRNPNSPEMRWALEKLVGTGGPETKPVTSKSGEAHTAVVKVVNTDEDLIRTVGATPGAIGIVDVYSINSSVKVLRVEGKLPFDAGYSLKAN